MENVDVFLCMGEKIAELKESGHDAFFEYSGHIDRFSCSFFNGKWSSYKDPWFHAMQSYDESNGDFVQKCQNAANLLMLQLG